MSSARHSILLVYLDLGVSDIFNTQQNRVRKPVRFIPPLTSPNSLIIFIFITSECSVLNILSAGLGAH